MEFLSKKIFADTYIFLGGLPCSFLAVSFLSSGGTSAYTDGNAILPCKTELHIFDPEPFIRFGVKLQNSLPNLRILLLPRRG